ncbi:MAG TPA: serine/threonine-protein kinase [Streptosporangiaceae bacterium]|nr:serine/threonine-protein kinase [Streptosporangiaceae bacterium]
MVSDLPWQESQFGPGFRIGKYVLEQQIGRGGMAVVFTARDDQLGRLVALKIMAPSVASDEEFRKRFVRESKAAAAVDDPHIIPLFEAGESAGVLFIAMRYVAGGDVRSLLAREGPLSLDRAAAILVSVASALDAAHAAGLVHRDVKPGNMLMDVRKGRPDHVYLADFGLTKATSGAVTLTGTGKFLGTADYAAPEQIRGRPVDGRTDQYALACAAIEMLTAQTPFPLEQAMDILTAHVTKPPPPLSARRDGLPAELDAVLGRALAKSPGDRYRSCGDFATAFQRAAGVGRYLAPVAAGESHPGTAGRAADDLDPGGARAEPATTRPSLVPRSLVPRSMEPGSMQPRSKIDIVRVRRRRGRWVIAAAAAAVVVAGAAVAFLTLAQPARAPGAHAAGTGHTPAVRAASAPRWHTYGDPSGFAIGLPPGWAVASTKPGDVQFTGMPSGFVLVVAWSSHPQADALADWRQQAAGKAATDSSYRQISIRRVRYRGYNAADWQFTNIYQGVRIRTIDRTFIVRPGRLAYAIELYGPASQWPAVYANIWRPVVASFRPAS